MSSSMLAFASPQIYGRPLSPLNPHHTSSSSPLSSPTPQSYASRPHLHALDPFIFSAPSAIKRHQTRYVRPPTESRRGVKYLRGPIDLFAEGTTPMEGAMWRERFTRRMEERDRRKKAREGDLARRRSLPEQLDEEEADRRSQHDDEEVRLHFFPPLPPPPTRACDHA